MERFVDLYIKNQHQKSDSDAKRNSEITKAVELNEVFYKFLIKRRQRLVSTTSEKISYVSPH